MKTPTVTTIGLGKVRIESGAILAADPCYLGNAGEKLRSDLGLFVQLDGLAVGEYEGQIALSEEGSVGGRVAALRLLQPTAIARRELIGHVGVDSGQMMLLDPSFLPEWEDRDDEGFNVAGNHNRFNYLGACAATLPARDGGADDRQGGVIGDAQAVVSSSGYGDGYYPVYALFDRQGRPVGIEVAFLEEDDEDIFDD